MGALLRAGQLALGAVLVGAVASSCYSAGAGTAPPTDAFYFPVGLAVSPAGDVLYAVNSDFDLQWNGGTLQDYDLARLRADAAQLIKMNLTTKMLPLPDDTMSSQDQSVIEGVLADFHAASIDNPIQGCPGTPLPGKPLGEQCAPPFPSSIFIKNSVIIGAFATEVQLWNHGVPTPTRPTPPQRLFIPVRGEAAVTYADLGEGARTPPGSSSSDKFTIFCDQGPDNRCGSDFKAGNDPNENGNTRHETMPGEPFGMAQTEDGTALAVTSQTATQTSLLMTGLLPDSSSGNPMTMQFVLDGLPAGGVGIAAVPHDPFSPVPPCAGDVAAGVACVRPAFLETNRNAAELDLLRYYDDDGSSMQRPFLQREAVYPITSNAIGSDSRGIAIDPTPRLACRAQGNDRTLCAQLPARLFFASRTPPVLGRGLIGGVPASGVGAYDPDQVFLLPPVSVSAGPSNVYLAPILDPQGALQLRVFLVLFDASQIVVYDPDAGRIEKVIDVGIGPFAMAFDPFSLEDVAAHKVLAAADRDKLGGSGPYRFAYVSSFTYSYVQMIDLDDSQPTPETFEQVVFTLGKPTAPKGQ